MEQSSGCWFKPSPGSFFLCLGWLVSGQKSINTLGEKGKNVSDQAAMFARENCQCERKKKKKTQKTTATKSLVFVSNFLLGWSSTGGGRWSRSSSSGQSPPQFCQPGNHQFASLKIWGQFHSWMERRGGGGPARHTDKVKFMSTVLSLLAAVWPFFCLWKQSHRL